MIQELLNIMHSGARKNKYRILLPVSGTLSRNMDILCHNTTLPGRTLTPVEAVIKGHKVQLVGETSFEGTWEATFYNTTDMITRNYFINWMQEAHSNNLDTSMESTGILGEIEAFANDINASVNKVKNAYTDPIGTFLGGVGAGPLYQRDLTIQQLDGEGNVTSAVTLIGAFPTNVGAVDLDDSTGDISTTSITFNYNDIKVDGLEEPPAGIVGILNQAKQFGLG